MDVRKTCHWNKQK